MEQNEATKQVAGFSTELMEVGNQYLELFNTQQFKHFFAPNAAVDWFGGTIRGPNKIHDFLKYNIGSQYDHKNFNTPKICDPIETKPSHYATQRLDLSTQYQIPKLNRITGITTLKNYADSDVEHSDNEGDGDANRITDIVSISSRTPERATTPKAQGLAGQLTPPTSRKKIPQPNFYETESDIETDDEETTSVAAKRQRRIHMPAFSYLRHFPRNSNKKKEHKQNNASLASSDDELELTQSTSKPASLSYGPLSYIEFTGLLQHKPNTPAIEGSLIAGDIRIRISYRRKTADQQLQFSLIVYEAATTPSVCIKRNLMLEFAEYDDIDTTVRPTGDRNETVTTASSTSLTEATNDLVNTLDTSDFSIAALRTPTKRSNTPPATPKRKPRLHSTMSTPALKRLQESPTAPTSAPKRSAARCLRL